jgi:hypothetical protein
MQAIDLDPSPAFERVLGGQDKLKQSIDFSIVGSSHASKVSKALENQGFSCHLHEGPNVHGAGFSNCHSKN